MEEATEFSICLNDEAFEPFIEELLDNLNYASCQDLINLKKFSGKKEACADFEEVEAIEIDDNSSLGRELLRLQEAGEFSPESFKQALLDEQIRNIDLSTMPMDKYITQLKDPDQKKQRKAITGLGCLISSGNKDAFKVLFNFFKELPPPNTIEEVHFKKEILRYLKRSDTRTILLPHLISELYRTPSNNAKRQ